MFQEQKNQLYELYAPPSFRWSIFNSSDKIALIIVGLKKQSFAIATPRFRSIQFLDIYSTLLQHYYINITQFGICKLLITHSLGGSRGAPLFRADMGPRWVPISIACWNSAERCPLYLPGKRDVRFRSSHRNAAETFLFHKLLIIVFGERRFACSFESGSTE